MGAAVPLIRAVAALDWPRDRLEIQVLDDSTDDTTELSAKPGKVTLDFTNESPVGHNVVIEDSGGKEIASTDVITGQSTTAEFTVKPGTYTFFCSIPGHEQAGMKGTLTVK